MTTAKDREANLLQTTIMFCFAAKHAAQGTICARKQAA